MSATVDKGFVKGLCVLFCNLLETGTEEKIHSSHTGNLHPERLFLKQHLTLFTKHVSQTTDILLFCFIPAWWLCGGKPTF